MDILEVRPDLLSPQRRLAWARIILERFGPGGPMADRLMADAFCQEAKTALWRLRRSNPELFPDPPKAVEA